MGNSWKYAQTLQFPQSDLCECGHIRKYHNRMKGYCSLCSAYGPMKDMSQPPTDDVFRFILGVRDKSEDCEKFRHWSTERVRAFWQIANIPIRFYTNKEQTILDAYLPYLYSGYW